MNKRTIGLWVAIIKESIAANDSALDALIKAQAKLCEYCPQGILSEQVGEHTNECLDAMDAIAKAQGGAK